MTGLPLKQTEEQWLTEPAAYSGQAHQPRGMTMQDTLDWSTMGQDRKPWNKDKLIGAKSPLRPKHIRMKLQVEGKAGDLAIFNLVIDSKLPGCDVAALNV